MERPEKGMGVLVPQEVRGLVELERRMQQVVASQLASRLLHELLKGRAVFRQSPLECPRAHAELSRDILDPRPPPGQLPLQDALDLLADRFRSERLRQLGVELRGEGRKELRVVRDEGAIEIRLAEHDRVLAPLEPRGAAEVRLVHLAVPRRSAKLEPPRAGVVTGPSAGDAHYPGEAEIHQDRWLRLLCEEPPEPNPTFATTLRHLELLGTGELLVACQPLERVPKRPRRYRGHGDRVVPLDTRLRPQLEADRRIVAGFRDPTVEGEEILGTDQDLLLIE